VGNLKKLKGSIIEVDIFQTCRTVVVTCELKGGICKQFATRYMN